MPGLLVDRFLKHFSNFFKPTPGATNALQTPMDEDKKTTIKPVAIEHEVFPERAHVAPYPKEKE